MSDDFSARLALPYLAAGQMQKHVTLNEGLTRLDALLQTAVISRTTVIQPNAPSDGDLYILPQTATGADWSGRAVGDLMRFEAGRWSTVAAPVGLIAVVLDTDATVVRTADGWVPLAERLGGGAMRRETTVFTGDGVYAPPSWARWIEVACVGGGSGGGAGLSGPAGTARFGGGGGGAGGFIQSGWSLDDLDGQIAVTVGAGGPRSGPGGESRIALAGTILLRATGGAPGSDGSASAASGGIGGLGWRAANPGGASSLSTTAASGGETVCPDGSGGGGAGGGLSAADVAHDGGAGGTGGWSGLRAAGGLAGAAGQGASNTHLSLVGGGGGGGSASTGGAGSPGGIGATVGAGGGGGGAGLTIGGSGGPGGAGVVRITAVG